MGFHHHYVHGPRLMPRLLGGASTGAMTLLGSEADGLSIDFTDASIVVRDTTTTSNAWVSGTNGDVQTFWRDRSFTSYSSPSPKITRDSSGYYTYRPHNLVAMSEKFASAYWTKTNGTITTDATTAPDGTSTADAAVVNNGSVSHEVTRDVTLAVGSVYTWSVYLKDAPLTNWVEVTVSTTAIYRSWFNLSTGAKGSSSGSPLSYTITDVGSGWYRCDITFVAGNSTTTIYACARPADADTGNITGDGTTIAFYLWGAMLNAGPAALTYTNTQAHNLCLQSADFATSWTNGDTTETTNAATAPDGTTTADRLVEVATSAPHSIAQQITTQTDQVFSVYVKAAERTFASLRFWSSTGHAVTVTFNLTTGAVTQTSNQGSVFSSVSSGVTSVGNDWHRCYVAASRASGTTFYAVDINTTGTPSLNTDGSESYAGNTSNGILLWGAAVELASSVGKYVTTTTAAVYESRYELPREWDSAGACQGLLVEEARTNVCLYSTQLDNALWSKSLVTVSANATTAPDGTATADKIVEDTSNGIHQAFQPFTGTAASWAGSVFLKGAGRTRAIVLMWDGSGYAGYVIFDLSGAGSVVQQTAGTGSITSVGNDWYRCTVVATLAASASCEFSIALIQSGTTFSYVGDASSGVYAWGAQLEAGAFVTSPIYTGSASVTRAVDNINPNTSVAPSTATAGTLFVKVGQVLETNSASMNWASLHDDTLNERIQVSSNATGTVSLAIVDGGAGQVSISGNDLNAGTHKIAASWAANDAAIYANGTQEGTDTSVTLPTVHVLSIGTRNGAADPINGYIKQIMVLPRAMTDGELQTVTT
jgi:hypothetical protein